MDALTPLAQHSLAVALLADADRGRVFAWREGRARRIEEYLADVAALAAHAGSQRYCVNLCEDRYRFLVAFGAAAAGRRITLLPAARTVTVVAELRTAYPDAEVISDDTVERALAAPAASAALASFIPDQAEVAIGFTSGSTAAPTPHRKRWGAFKQSSARLLELVASHLPDAAAPTLVATVPPQHMFGLETSVLLPLFGRVAVHAGRPLLPADIARALAEVPEPRLLVSTPLHLENLVASAVRLPKVALVLCATAPLRAELAQAVERELGTELREIFGSTETCAIAHRRTAIEQEWQLFPDVALQPLPEATRVEAPWLPPGTLLQDVVELLPGRRFALRGRNSDMVEIAGKRASLADLNRRLLAVPGVRDAYFCQPDALSAVRRVAALVVAPGIDAAEILACLRHSVDPAFLPRPLVLVDALPRNEIGKLPRERMLELLNAGGANWRSAERMPDAR
jgi:acyl-coenzyme A synthetase/AMP-(fatty) acid ligase